MIRLLSSGCKEFVLEMVFIVGFLFLPGFNGYLHKIESVLEYRSIHLLILRVI